MKSKRISFRPRADLRERLERLQAKGEHSMSYYVEKCIEGHLPVLEAKYGLKAPAVPTRYKIPPRSSQLNEGRQ